MKKYVHIGIENSGTSKLCIEVESNNGTFDLSRLLGTQKQNLVGKAEMCIYTRLSKVY